MTFTSPQFFRVVDLLDVSGEPTDNQVLAYDAATGEWGPESFTEGATSLSELSDVASASQTANFVLATPDGSGGDYIGRALVADDLPAHTHAATDVTSGNFADARISESSVTQHESALTITESQISDLGSYITDLSEFDTDNLSEGSANLYFTEQRVDDRVNELLVEGSGISIIENTDGTLTISATEGGGSSTLSGLDDVAISSVADGELLAYDSGSSDWINQTLAEAGIAAASHTHSASQITSGTLAVLRGGTGFGALPSVSNYTPTGSNYPGHLTGIDNALGTKIEDLSGFDTDDLSEGATNLYFTNERVDDRVNALLVQGTNITLTYDDGAGTLTIDAAGGGGSSTLSGLDDVTISSVADGELLVYDSASSDWINQTLAEAGVAATGHTHAASDIISGTFANARISESSVTQHEDALTITESQISDLGSYYSEGDTLRAASGSSSAPGLSFSANTNFGLYMQSSSRMDIVANGTAVAQLSNNTIFSTAVFQAEVTQFVASISWVASSTNSIFSNTTTSAGAKITLREGSANGTSGISFSAPASLASNEDFVVPGVDGTADQVLTTDGSGNLSFSDNDDKLIHLCFQFPEAINDDYPVVLYMPSRGGTLSTIRYKTQGGSCTLRATLDATTITSWGSLSVTSTEGSAAATGANTFSGGETLSFNVSSASSIDMLQIVIEGEFD